MGYAHGQLMKNELPEFNSELWLHLEEQFYDDEDDPTWLPPWIQNWIADVGLDIMLQLTADATAPFTPEYWFEELHGLVDGVGNSTVTFEDLYYLTLFGELTKGTCSMFGAWGDAIEHVTGVDLLQLRALDWDTGGPFPKYPAVVVYHPDQGHAFANVGWIGWIGSITGMSSSQMAISEIGIYFTDSSWGNSSRFGYPFTAVLRDILQFDNTVDDTISRLSTTHRTCDLLFGVGDGKAPEFRGFQYSYSVLNVFDDQNLQPDNATWHPRMNDIVYWGMDWDCPSYNKALHKGLSTYYGNITVENTIQNILPSVQTGDTHVAIYDLTNQFMYYAHVGLENTTNRNAYQRPFTKLNMQQLFSESNPKLSVI